jgi:phosphoglycolate phosphatase-like HAD superfamily hydrolase
MKIIFLDIDGVLNDSGWRHHATENLKPLVKREDFTHPDDYQIAYKKCEISPANVALLNWLYQKTGASLVITSSWRRTMKLNQITEALRLSGVYAPVYDQVPKQDYLIPPLRGKAIEVWLTQHPEVTCHVALDDDVDLLMTSAVRTSSYTGGFNVLCLQQALEILGDKDV